MGKRRVVTTVYKMAGPSQTKSTDDRGEKVGNKINVSAWGRNEPELEQRRLSAGCDSNGADISWR